MDIAFVKFEKDRLSVEFGDGKSERRDLQEADHRRFLDWAVRYRTLLQSSQNDAALLALGKEIYTWLDGPASWINQILEVNPTPPVNMGMAIASRPDQQALSFLEVPWELVADEKGYLAADSQIKFNPLRCIGPRRQPVAASDYRLSVVFMAAAPENAGPHLNYEQEESAIIEATETGGMDLVVEESGTLKYLGGTMAAEKPVDVLHISCHGRSDDPPASPCRWQRRWCAPETASCWSGIRKEQC